MPSGQIFELAADEELRIEVECPKEEDVTVELRTGVAEIFGSEMVANHKYTFKTGAKFAVFSYHGCQILITGNLGIQPYTSSETPMIMYLNIHAALEKNRVDAEKSSKGKGPVTMIVGPTDSGKSTLCRLLLNYAVRMGRSPVFVDLDVGQGSISVPGSIGAVLVERPAIIEEGGFAETAPLVYHYGHTTPGHNPVLFNKLVSRMADVVRERTSASRKAEIGGVVINTCGWVRGEGYNQIKHIAQAFEVDVIMVLDQERLYNDLVRDMPKFVNVVWLPKSGGVVEKSVDQRNNIRDERIKEYYYGHNKSLLPFSFDVDFSKIKDKIYKIGAPSLPSSCMPLGMEAESNQMKLVRVNLTAKDLLHHVVAVSFANKTDDLIITNVAGFIVVTQVIVETQKLIILSPQPKPLPNAILVLSELQFVDTD